MGYIKDNHQGLDVAASDLQREVLRVVYTTHHVVPPMCNIYHPHAIALVNADIIRHQKIHAVYL